MSRRDELEAKYSALGGELEDHTRQRVERIEVAERFAEAIAEGYCRDVGGVIERLHHTAAFVMETQKLAKDARYRLAQPHMTGPNGEPPTGVTINPNGRNLLEYVIVSASSRPGVRWVLDGTLTFASVVNELAGDSQCDAAEEPFRRSLAPFYPQKVTPDCVGLMAEHAALQRGKRPNITVGLLFPVAFGSEIVVLKLCHAHGDALVRKYRKPVRDTGLEEDFEGIGNYW